MVDTRGHARRPAARAAAPRADLFRGILFRGVEAFVAVAEHTSFRGAAVVLGVSPAAISKAVQALEADLGARVFVRGPRSVALTREGALFLAHARPAVVSLRAGREAIEGERTSPRGSVTLSAPFVASPLVAPAVALLRARHAKLEVTLKITDRLVRLGDEGVEVGLRIGALASSSLLVRKLRSTRLITVASPAYLAARGTPQAPGDLAHHTCIAVLGPSGRPHPFLFASGPSEAPAQVLVDYGPAVIDATVAGVGIGQVFDFMAGDALRLGQLVRILEDHVARGPDVQAVCAPGGLSSSRVRAVVDALVQTVA